MPDDKQSSFPGFSHVSKAIPKIKKPGSSKMRVIQAAVNIKQDDLAKITYQHSVLCQTCMPYKNPGAEVTAWNRNQGNISLRIRAGEIQDRQTGEWKTMGLPFGPKPRLIMAYLNGEAIRTKSPVIEVQDSLTAFIKRIGLDTNGRNLRTIRDQLGRLSCAEIKMAMHFDNRYKQAQGHIVKDFELWFPKHEKQRVFWNTTVTLSSDYFKSLSEHAVPLDERAIGALAHSALALDMYSWMAQRLHRVHEKEAGFVAWKNLKDQFGPDYVRMCKFKEKFREALKQVHAIYPDAKFYLDGRGMTLFHSLPPVRKKLISQA
jgi:hypothetical protein